MKSPGYSITGMHTIAEKNMGAAIMNPETISFKINPSDSSMPSWVKYSKMSVARVRGWPMFIFVNEPGSTIIFAQSIAPMMEAMTMETKDTVVNRS